MHNRRREKLCLSRKQHRQFLVYDKVIAQIVGHVASDCYGVLGMAARSATDNFISLLKGDDKEKGVKIVADNDEINIEIHIVVIYGININAISSSIINKVTYCVQELTGYRVSKVDVFVDSMKA